MSDIDIILTFEVSIVGWFESASAQIRFSVHGFTQAPTHTLLLALEQKTPLHKNTTFLKNGFWSKVLNSSTFSKKPTHVHVLWPAWLVRRTEHFFRDKKRRRKKIITSKLKRNENRYKNTNVATGTAHKLNLNESAEKSQRPLAWRGTQLMTLQI
jgi:hypothetical protein